MIIIIFQNDHCFKPHIEAQDHHYVKAEEKERQDHILSETMIIMIIRIVIITLLFRFSFFYDQKKKKVDLLPDSPVAIFTDIRLFYLSMKV